MTECDHNKVFIVNGFYQCMKYTKTVSIFFILAFLIVSCKHKPLPNQEMIDLLKATNKYEDNHENVFCPEAFVRYADSMIGANPSGVDFFPIKLRLGNSYMELGEEQKAIN